MSDPTQSDRLAVCTQFVNEVWSKGNTSLIDEIVDREYVEHHPGGSVLDGRDELVAYVTDTRAGLSNFTKTIEDSIVGDEKVVLRYTATGTHDSEFRGNEPTGNQIDVDGILIYHVRNGLLTEGWEISDSLRLLQQINAIPE